MARRTTGPQLSLSGVVKDFPLAHRKVRALAGVWGCRLTGLVINAPRRLKSIRSLDCVAKPRLPAAFITGGEMSRSYFGVEKSRGNSSI